MSKIYRLVMILANVIALSPLPSTSPVFAGPTTEVQCNVALAKILTTQYNSAMRCARRQALNFEDRSQCWSFKYESCTRKLDKLIHRNDDICIKVSPRVNEHGSLAEVVCLSVGTPSDYPTIHRPAVEAWAAFDKM